MFAGMKPAIVRSRAPRRIGIACVLTGPPAVAVHDMRHAPPSDLDTHAISYEHHRFRIHSP
jgi:hypothetical protein